MLLAAGAMEALALLALIPDALAGSGRLGPTRAVPDPVTALDGPPVLVDDEMTAAPPFGSHLSARHS
jgi:hypothetical protein